MENGDNSIGKPEREVRPPGPSRVIALRINESIIPHFGHLATDLR